jgi:hypothetical protein
MKIKFAFSLSMMAAVLAIFLFACSKQNSEPVQPAYAQFIGTWEGKTSQNQSISIGITALNDLLVVNTYNYTVIRYDSGGSSYRSKHYEVSTSTVVTSVLKKYFKFTPYDPVGSSDFLTGTFNDTTMTLTGGFSTAFPKLTGSGSDIITGSYSAKKLK